MPKVTPIPQDSSRGGGKVNFLENPALDTPAPAWYSKTFWKGNAMFKTWALIVIVSTSGGQNPQEKGRYYSLDQCMLHATLAMNFPKSKQSYQDLAKGGFCYQTRTGDMYRVWDYVVGEIKDCEYSKLCSGTPKNVKPPVDLTHRNSSRFVYRD